VGHGAGIERIGFGQLPGRFRTGPYLAGIDHHDRQVSRDHGPVVASSRFEHNEHGLHGLEPDNGGSCAHRSVRDRPAVARGPQGDIELRFGDIHTNKNLSGRHHNS
jgi:hypothetical protein